MNIIPTISLQSKLTQVVIKLNRECNLACTYCYYINENTQNRGLFLDVGVFETFVQGYDKYCQSLNITGNIVFHGGEPLLLSYPKMIRFLEIVRGAKTNFKITLQTNGTLLNEKWLSILQSFRVSVGVSLDGPPAVHDKHRLYRGGRPSYNAVLRAIDAIRSADLSVGVLAVADPEVSGAEVLSHFVDIGVDWADLLMPIYDHSTLPSDTDFQLGLNEYFFSAFVEWLSGTGERLPVRLFEQLVLHAAGFQSGFFPLGTTSWERFAVLEADGTLCRLEELAEIDRKSGTNFYRFGHVRTAADISNFVETSRILYSRLHGDRLPTNCTDCSANGVCRGGPFESRYSEVDGSFNHSSALCGTLYGLATIAQKVVGASASTTKNPLLVATT